LRFWFVELRTPQLLIDLASAHGDAWRRLMSQRPLLKLARAAKESDLITALFEEERQEREADREYWLPLKKELEQLRRARFRQG
jgi:hypothetical protein